LYYLIRIGLLFPLVARIDGIRRHISFDATEAGHCRGFGDTGRQSISSWFAQIARWMAKGTSITAST
jgi:hypothetical protein